MLLLFVFKGVVVVFVFVRLLNVGVVVDVVVVVVVVVVDAVVVVFFVVVIVVVVVAVIFIVVVGNLSNITTDQSCKIKLSAPTIRRTIENM